MRTPVLPMVLTLALLLAACASNNTANEPVASPTTTMVNTTTSSILPTTAATTTTTTTTTTRSTTTTTTLVTGSTSLSADGTVLTTHDVSFTSELEMDVLSPTTSGPLPVVIVFHGGGWVGGYPGDITPLATEIAAAGAVVFNAPYRLALRGGGYPMTFEDASCAVRFARQHAPQFGGDPESITVVGYSAGAHIGAVTALAGDSFVGDCTVESGSALPDSFVGVAGPYDSDLLDPFMRIFFGTDRVEDPAPWENGNPHTHIGANPDLIVRLIHGRLDLLAPAGFAVGFHSALQDAGYDVALTIIDDGDHRSVVDPTADANEVVAAVLAVSG